MGEKRIEKQMFDIRPAGPHRDPYVRRGEAHQTPQSTLNTSEPPPQQVIYKEKLPQTPQDISNNPSESFISSLPAWEQERLAPKQPDPVLAPEQIQEPTQFEQYAEPISEPVEQLEDVSDTTIEYHNEIPSFQDSDPLPYLEDFAPIREDIYEEDEIEEDYEEPEVVSEQIPETQVPREKLVHLPKLSLPKISIPKPSLGKIVSHAKVGFPQMPAFSLNPGLRPVMSAGLAIVLIIWGVSFVQRGFHTKDVVIAEGLEAYANLYHAGSNIANLNSDQAQHHFTEAYSNFERASQEVQSLGGVLINLFEVLPGSNIVSSGTHMLEIGQNVSNAGRDMARAMDLLTAIEFSDIVKLEQSDFDTSYIQTRASITDTLLSARRLLLHSQSQLANAADLAESIKLKSIPDEYQHHIALLKQSLPVASDTLKQFLDLSDLLLNLLGHENPRSYLLLFQNSSEIRPTGGFIGSYGLVRLDQGSVTQLKVDNIFNIDGQLITKVVPPKPIQDISSAWSTHDANWFYDFPTSAQKVMWFFEETGSRSVDGVIAITPAILEQLLDITGPIVLPEHDATLTSNNVIEILQFKVEVDFDEEENKPKKILRDAVPKIFEKLSRADIAEVAKIVDIMSRGLLEKDIQIYFSRDEEQEVVEQFGWDGGVMDTEKDYLAVVSTNINGFKTDRVIDTTVDHRARIDSSGAIVNTVTVTKKHTGGEGDLKFYNKVNKDWLRIYVPSGAQLLSATGTVSEVYEPPLDYDELKFLVDPNVKEIENFERIDPESGVHISRQHGKTVFANWMFVSPGETESVTVMYRLPFALAEEKSSTYTLLAQKQAGIGLKKFNSEVHYPSSWTPSTVYPHSTRKSPGSLGFTSRLATDTVWGVLFKKQ